MDKEILTENDVLKVDELIRTIREYKKDIFELKRKYNDIQGTFSIGLKLDNAVTEAELSIHRLKGYLTKTNYKELKQSMLS